MRSSAVVAITLILAGLRGTNGLSAAEPALPGIARLLSAGQETVRVVCFGDSITGVYYHTGGRRAWTDMLGIALKRIYPNAKLQMTNAGISGHTTAQGLKRIKRDVLAKKPHLVVVMFGMNDVVGTPQAVYAENLWQIIRQCRAVGAEVVLCTPNSIYPEDPRRPAQRLAAFCASVRAVAREMHVPLVDCYAAYEAIRGAQDAVEWKLLMSETIHPNMNGHKRFAEDIAAVISGQRVSLADVRAVEPCIPQTLGLLARGKPIRLIAMEPYDRIVSDLLKTLEPRCAIQVIRWPTQGKSLAKLEAWSKSVRAQKPDLVVVAVPADALPSDTERLIRSYSWVLNYSLPFGQAIWDLVAIMPSVTGPTEAPAGRAAADLTRRIIIGQDIGLIERPVGEDAPPGQIILRWLQAQRARFRPMASRPGA